MHKFMIGLLFSWILQMIIRFFIKRVFYLIVRKQIRHLEIEKFSLNAYQIEFSWSYSLKNKAYRS